MSTQPIMADATGAGAPRAALAEQERLERAVAERTLLLRQAADKLEQALRAHERDSRIKDDLLAEICHELRTPLSAVLGFSEILKSHTHGPLGDARYDTHIGHIHGAASYMLDLVNSILDYAKAGSGADAVAVEPVDIGDLVRSTVALVQAQAAAAGVELAVSLDPDLEIVQTDRTKLRQILLNLVSNAVKFTPSGGRVKVEAMPTPDRGALILVVRDTGIGMAEQDLEAAMRPYGQVKAARKGGPRGTGLGLPLAKRYVEMLGGTLEIKSRPGQGTTVMVRLPAYPDSEAPAAKA